MRSNRARLALVLVATIAAVCTSGCKKSAESRRREAAKTELRSGRANEPEVHVLGEDEDVFTRVRHEQLELRARLRQEIDAIDKKLAEQKVELRDGGYVVDPRSKHAGRIKELVARRNQLEEDLLTVERADERNWAEVKSTVEKDLGPEPRPRGRI